MKTLYIPILVLPVPGFLFPRFRSGTSPSRHVSEVQWTRHDEAFRIANVMIGPMDPALHDIARQVTAVFASANQNISEYNACIIRHEQSLLHGGRIKKAKRVKFADDIHALDAEYVPLHENAVAIWTKFEHQARTAHPELEHKYRIVFDETNIGWNGHPSRYDDTGEWYPPPPFEQRLFARVSTRHCHGKRDRR